MDKVQLEQLCKDSGYTDLKIFQDGSCACIAPFAFTHAIISGLNRYGYEDRWCYKTYAAAKEALCDWDGEDEPDGWHRHPLTGRRRENGIETINF